MSRQSALGWAVLGAALSAAVLLALSFARTAPDDGGEEAAPAAEVPADPGQGKVRLEADEQRRIGLTTAVLQSTSAPAVVGGFARGLDGSSLAGIDADLASARAALEVSQAQVTRLSTLYAQDQSASLEALQAARAQAQSETARLELASRRIGLEYGPGLAELSDADRHALIAQMASGDAALVRIDVPGEVLNLKSRVCLSDGGRALQLLGPAASVDPRLQSPGMLAVLRGPAALSAASGRIFPVQVAGAGEARGVFVPSAAVLRWRDGLWIYQPAGPELFARVELVNAQPRSEGWFVPGGLRAGDSVVTRGAGTLLGVERGGAPADQD